MKLRFNGLFDLEDLKVINDFVAVQETTDCVREPCTILLDNDLTVKIFVKKWDKKQDYSLNNSYISKLIFTKIKEMKK